MFSRLGLVLIAVVGLGGYFAATQYTLRSQAAQLRTAKATQAAQKMTHQTDTIAASAMGELHRLEIEIQKEEADEENSTEFGVVRLDWMYE